MKNYVDKIDKNTRESTKKNVLRLVQANDSLICNKQ